ncbi:hypothetical protein B0533_09130 [Sedimentibacter sp. SX930]|nr:hypothetical protein B0533_09130 [Sedimentibacter sp. SX930]
METEKKVNKTIITVALTGSQGTKKLNPNTPVSCDEIIEDAYQCYLNGAAIVHIHVKADDGIHVEIDNEKFAYIKAGIQRKCDLIVNFTTSGEMNHFEGLDLIGTADGQQDKRIGILDTHPEIATFDVPTMNFGERIFMNPLPFLRNLGKKMQELKILPEVEIYNRGDIGLAEQLIEEGVIPADSFFQLCLGIKGGTPATVKDLVYLTEALPPNVSWSAFGVGADHMRIMYATLALGGNIRVGLEDNLYYTKGCLTSNAELVKRAARLIREYGNEVATSNEARGILKLSN